MNVFCENKRQGISAFKKIPRRGRKREREAFGEPKLIFENRFQLARVKHRPTLTGWSNIDWNGRLKMGACSVPLETKKKNDWMQMSLHDQIQI